MTNRCCANCHAYRAMPSPACHKSPPTVHIVVSAIGTSMQVHGLFPPTKPENWCAQHVTATPEEMQLAS